MYCKFNKFGGINNLGDRPEKWGKIIWGVNNLGDGFNSWETLKNTNTVITVPIPVRKQVILAFFKFSLIVLIF